MSAESAHAAATRIVRRACTAPLLPDVHPVLARVYAARAIANRDDAQCALAQLHPPQELKDIQAACLLLAHALTTQQRILIVADFDADGATSCALAVRGLRAFGAQHVDYLVPNRFEYGYGLTPEIVALAAQRHPQLLVTVDNGIASVEGVAAARACGISVLVTDHHLPGAQLPAAHAIVNPNQPGDLFPSKHLAGVGVIFYVLSALRAHLRACGWFVARGVAEPNLANWLDLVALGTVADVVALDRNNRILVKHGLARINQGHTSAGIKALLSVAGRQPGNLNAADLGFCVAPRLNAAGRLTDMSLGIECLLSDDASAAMQMAQELDRLNRARRVIEADMQQGAADILARLQLAGALPHGLCLFDETWHQGVIGILAGRLKDKLHRPVIAFAPANGDDIKGSARSVAGVHVRDVLAAIAAQHPDMLQKFGGHALAAGLTLPRAQLARFSAAFDAQVSRQLDAAALHGQVLSDGALAADDLDVATAELLRAGGPWGQGFPEPMFDGEFTVIEHRWLGERHLKLRLRVDGAARVFDAIAFNQTPVATMPRRLHAAYRLDVNEYQGLRSLQLVIAHWQGLDTPQEP